MNDNDRQVLEALADRPVTAGLVRAVIRERDEARATLRERNEDWSRCYGQLTDANATIRALVGQQRGVALIATERQRQIEVEGWTPEHDRGHADALLEAAICYAEQPSRRFPDVRGIPGRWPWQARFWKPTPGDRLRELVKAGALIAAEIDRLAALGGSPEETANSPEPAFEERVEYGHQTAEAGWVPEIRGIQYASHQRTVQWRVIGEPVAIDHWTYADHRHPVAGCTHYRHDLTTEAAVQERLGPVQATTDGDKR